MISALKIIREVYKFWNKPSAARLDPEAVVEALNRVWCQRKLDLGLSGGSYLAKVSEEFAFFEGRTLLLSESGAAIEESFTEARVERRRLKSTVEEEWVEVYIGGYSDWSAYQYDSRPYAAFYGSPDDPTMIVNHDPTSYGYRLIYEPSGCFDGNEISDGTIDLPSLFQPLLTYDTAIEAGMLIDDDSPEFARKLSTRTSFLAGRQTDALLRFQKWLSSRKPKAATSRTAFNERKTDLTFPGRNNFNILID